MVDRQLVVDFFLIAHDPFDEGRLRISPELFGCGLVGAELADLVLGRRLGIAGEDLVILEPSGQLDEVDDYVIEAVGSQDSVHPVRSWVEPLQDGLYALVARKLVASGMVRRVAGGRRLGRGRQPDRFPPNDLLAASRPQQLLQQMLASPADLTLGMGMLAALIGALGMDGLLDADVDRSTVREILGEIEQFLPTDLRAVCDGVRMTSAEVSLRAR